MSLWTASRVEVLKSMWADGASFSQIAKELDCGLSRNACIGKANRIGLRDRTAHPPRTTERSKLASATPRERRNQGLAILRVKRALRQSKPKPPKPVVELERPYHFIGIGLFDIGRNQCRFPQGEGTNILFCGSPTDEGASWCRHCRGAVFSKHKMTDEERQERGRLLRAGRRIAQRQAEQQVRAA